MRDDVKGPVRLRDVLDPLGERLGIGRASDNGVVWSRWHEIVGDAIAEHAEPSSLRAGVLRVRAGSAIWASELGYLAPEIRVRTNRLLGHEAVREVKIWTGPLSGARRSAKRAMQGTAGQKSHPSGGQEKPSSDDPVEALERARSAWLRRREGRA